MNRELLSLTSKVRYRAVGEDGVLVHLDNGKVIVVNEVGLHIVKALALPNTREQLAASIALEFNVGAERAAEDLHEYLAELDVEQILEHHS